MQRDLILHIGLSKTGSSSIQRVLASQRDALRAQGMYMPQSPGWANHALLPAAFVNDPRILWGFHPGTWGLAPATRLERFRKEWAAELNALPDWASRCVITAEQIGGLLRADDEVQRLADNLQPYFANIQVVAYLRRQDQHAASAYSQWLRGGVLTDPALPDGGPELQPEYDLGPLLDRFARAFGDAAMRPRIFDRASLAGGDVVEDFLQLTGIDLPIAPETPNRKSNLGITLVGQNLLLAAGRRLAATAPDDLWRDTPQWRRLAEAVSEAMPGSGWRPHARGGGSVHAAFCRHQRTRPAPLFSAVAHAVPARFFRPAGNPGAGAGGEPGAGGARSGAARNRQQRRARGACGDGAVPAC
ncbi:MAG: hypothetical protein WDN04_23780 [Rhodospirillales bacterium]